MPEPSSLGADTDIPMDIDSSDMNSDGSRGLDDTEEPSPPEDKMFFLDPSDLDVERDEEAVKTIRYACAWVCQELPPDAGSVQVLP